MTFVWLKKLVYKRVVSTFAILLLAKQGIIVNILLTKYNTVSKGSVNIFNSTSGLAKDNCKYFIDKVVQNNVKRFGQHFQFYFRPSKG